jgi:hypothetical protein
MTRTFTIALAVLAAAALAGPSSAFAGKSHLLGVYKVEKHLDLEGEEGSYTLSCEGTDIAIDGMWRIDNVDQDNGFVYGSPPFSSLDPAWDVLKSVEVVDAYASSDSTYTFKFVPQSGGDVQGKLFLFCLPRQTTQTAGHQHTWYLHSQAVSVPAIFAPGDVPVVNGNSPCSAGEIAIQPGIKGTSGSGHLYERWSNAAPGSNVDQPLSWSISAIPGIDGYTYAVNWSCLRLKSSSYPIATPNHAHRIVPKWRPINVSPSSVNETLPANAVSNPQVICGEHYKAALGSFRITGSPYDHWYLGMDPRPKSRVFKMLNDTALAGTAQFGAVCFKDSTT